MTTPVPVPPKHVDAWVCFCHNAPVFLGYYNGQVMHGSCTVFLDGADLERIKEARKDKWFITSSGHLLDNQGVWSDEPPPIDGPQWQQSDLVQYSHMYIWTDFKIDEHLDVPAQVNGLYLDQTRVRIRMRRNLFQEYALDSESRRVKDPHKYIEDAERVYDHVHTWVGYVPHVAEVRKAEFDWLATQSTIQFYKFAAHHGGLRQGVAGLS